VSPLRPDTEHELDLFGNGPWLLEEKIRVPFRRAPSVKGDTPASSSSQFPIGVHSAARLGANVAAPPLKFQLVDAPTSRIATGSSTVGYLEALA
jgi:hypothetical protein